MMAEPADARKVFLSHSNSDKAEVEALRVALDARSIACSLDALELKAGDVLAARLKEDVQEARAFVVVLSPAAVSSKWVRQEIEWALAAEDRATETGGRFRFLPVFTGGVTHGFLGWLERPEVLGIPRWARMARTTAGSWTVAMARSRPPHRGQARTSKANTRRIHAAQVQACGRPAGRAPSPGSAEKFAGCGGTAARLPEPAE